MFPLKCGNTYGKPWQFHFKCTLPLYYCVGKRSERALLLSQVSKQIPCLLFQGSPGAAPLSRAGGEVESQRWMDGVQVEDHHPDPTLACYLIHHRPWPLPACLPAMDYPESFLKVRPHSIPLVRQESAMFLECCNSKPFYFHSAPH